MEAYRTRAERKRWAREIEQIEQLDPKKRPKHDGPSRESQAGNSSNNTSDDIRSKSLEELLAESGYSVVEDSTEPVQPEPVRTPSADQHDDGNLHDPTLPRNRTNNLGIEPFPPPPAGVPTTTVTEEVDPTLPQNRPDEVDEVDTPTSSRRRTRSQSRQDSRQPSEPSRLLQPNGSTSLPAPRSLDSSSPEAEATAPKFSPTLKSAASPSRQAQVSPTLPPQETQPPRPPSPQTLSRWAFLNQVEREAKERGGGAKLNFEEFRQRMNTDRGRRLGFVSSWIEMASF